jgi:hypothetical protein
MHKISTPGAVSQGPHGWPRAAVMRVYTIAVMDDRGDGRRQPPRLLEYRRYVHTQSYSRAGGVVPSLVPPTIDIRI